MPSERKPKEIAWKVWSRQAFDEAKRTGRLVLLDLTASWCHWCHVMDRKTYDNDEIAGLINDNFVPIRVNIDQRPDISERYNRGGFPTTAFLSDQGESVWGSTYIPPTDMKRIIGSILQAKRSGEIERALERGRMPYLDISKAAMPKDQVTAEELDDVFEEIFSSYDVEHGGFGIEPKFPHPDVLDVLLTRFMESKDVELADAATNTLEKMTEGLYDGPEGGVFRYSVSRDWRTPHYEKMLETNLGYLRNLVHAYAVTEKKDFEMRAKGVAKYLLGTLRDAHSGGFYGSQDADEEYYRSAVDERRKREAPSVDRTAYAGWNADAARVLLASGKVLGQDDWIDAGLGAWRNLVGSLWDPDRKLVRHQAREDIYLFEDQVSFLEALLEVLETAGDESLHGLAEELMEGVDRWFANEDGGYNDVIREGDAIGELGTPRRPLVENSDWALALASFGTITHRDDLTVKARSILSLFGRSEIYAHGLFGAAYLRARWVLDKGPVSVVVHALPERLHERLELCKSARSVVHPAIMVSRVADDHAPKAFAVVCSGDECLPKIHEPAKLRNSLTTLIAERRR